MRQIATVICSVAFATVGWNLSRTYFVQPQNTAMASTPFDVSKLSPIRTEVHDTITVPDSIARDTVLVQKDVVKHDTVVLTKRVKDNVPIVKNKTSKRRRRVTSSVSDTVSTDVQSTHTNTREVRKGTPPDSLHQHVMEIHGYIWPVSETR